MIFVEPASLVFGILPGGFETTPVKITLISFMIANCLAIKLYFTDLVTSFRYYTSLRYRHGIIINYS